MTMEPIEIIGRVNGDERAKTYVVAKVTLENDTLTAAGLNMEFKPLKDAKTPEALERVVGENVKEAGLYVRPIVAVKWAPERMKDLEALQERFREWKP